MPFGILLDSLVLVFSRPQVFLFLHNQVSLLSFNILSCCSKINLHLVSILSCPTAFQMLQALSKASCFQSVCLSSFSDITVNPSTIVSCLSLLFFFTPSFSLYFSTDCRFYGNKEREAGLGLMERCQTARRSDRVCVCVWPRGILSIVLYKSGEAPEEAVLC